MCAAVPSDAPTSISRIALAAKAIARFAAWNKKAFAAKQSLMTKCAASCSMMP